MGAVAARYGDSPFVIAAQNAEECDNPVSITLKALNIHVKEEGKSARTLVESFSDIADRIVEELRDSRKEREMLWDKLYQPPADPTLDDLSGILDYAAAVLTAFEGTYLKAVCERINGDGGLGNLVAARAAQSRGMVAQSTNALDRFRAVVQEVRAEEAEKRASSNPGT